MNPSIEVLGVAMGPVEGLWEVVIEARGKKGIAYVDFSKEHVITGSVLKVSTKENLTSLRLYALSKIDLSTIPLDEAIVMGRADAKYKAVVFDDPD
jgi:thiol:disulfide interchange protein DsbC